MKKKFMFIGVLLATFIFTSNVYAAPKGSSNLDYSTCIAFADGYKNIATSVGSYYYKYCYRATCSNNTYQKANMTAVYGFRCQNGNYDPYRKVTSDGCSGYTGSCNTNNGAYCTTVEYVDCNKTSSGATYLSPTTTTTTTTKITTTTTTTKKATTTTKKTTTKKTTTKKTTTTQTTTQTTEPVTEETTTTTEVVGPSNDTSVKSILINGTEVTDLDMDEHKIGVPFGTEELEVIVELTSDKATYEVLGNTEITDDEENHMMYINITAEDGTTRTMSFSIYHKLSSDCTLANIYIENYDLKFAKNTYSYKLKLAKSVTTVDLEVVLSDEKSTYSIEGNENLKNKSEIKVVVKAEDGTTCNYIIKVKKSSDTWKIILVVVLLIGVVVAGSISLYRYLKKSKGKYKYE